MVLIKINIYLYENKKIFYKKISSKIPLKMVKNST